MKTATLIVFYVLSVIAAAAFSARGAMKNQMIGFEAELAQTQGMLAYNHLQRYQELEESLSKGCNAAVLEKLKISAANERVLLASFLRDRPNGWLQKYVSDRSAGLPEQLATYKSPYGTSWTE